ncbi:MAG: hypothetical protein ACQEP4_02445 [Bacillota bacterium]
MKKRLLNFALGEAAAVITFIYAFYVFEFGRSSFLTSEPPIDTIKSAYNNIFRD